MSTTRWPIVFSVILLISSCGAVRKANRIEYLFLDHYINEMKSGQAPKGYSVQTSYSSGTTTISSSGHVHHGLGTYSVDVTLIDTVNDISYAIDDAKGVFKLAKNNKNCERYYKKYLHQKRWQRIGRYGSIAAMGLGITLLASTDSENASKTKSQTRAENAGSLLILGGFFDWIGGGFTRAITRRTTIMKAAYVYQFGSLPKHLPPISRASKRVLLLSNPMFH